MSIGHVIYQRSRDLNETRFGCDREIEDAILTRKPMASSSSLALSTLLSTLHTHLNAQTQLLPQLHSQLGLPATALEDELQELQHNLTRAVESQIDVRKKQVEEWEAKCEEVESRCSRYARTLGTHAKVAGSLNDIKSEKVLPRRHERAMEYQERLRQVRRWMFRFEGTRCQHWDRCTTRSSSS